MKIESITIKNFKSLKDIHLKNLPTMAVFIGANATGKTTLFDVFEFLGDALKYNVRQALQKRGGFKEVLSRGGTGPIAFEIKYSSINSQKDNFFTYVLEINEENDNIVISNETLSYRNNENDIVYYFLKFKNGIGTAITQDDDFSSQKIELLPEEHVLASADILAIKGLGQFEKFKAANFLRAFIENWHISNFQTYSGRASSEAGFEEHLSSTGDNLPLFALYLYEKYPAIFKVVLEKMSLRIPGINEISAEKTQDGRVLLKFKDGTFKDPFIASQVSDGTLKMFTYLLLLHDPKPHPLLCVEEPENQLYPSLLPELLEEFRNYGERGGQVFITSHSPDLLNAVQAHELYWMVKKSGFTEVFKASEDVHLMIHSEAGESLGDLWRQKYFPGLDPGFRL